MLGGPVGALAGAALGHLYDEDDPTPKNEQKARILYLAYFFSCAAKVAKADGGISAAEIETVESIMNRMGMDEKTREFAKNVFRKAKTSRRSIDEDLKEVAQLIGYEPTVGQSFLGGLYEIVRSNGAKLNELPEVAEGGCPVMDPRRVRSSAIQSGRRKRSDLGGSLRRLGHRQDGFR